MRVKIFTDLPVLRIGPLRVGFNTYSIKGREVICIYVRRAASREHKIIINVYLDTLECVIQADSTAVKVMEKLEKRRPKVDSSSTEGAKQ